MARCSCYPRPAARNATRSFGALPARSPSLTIGHRPPNGEGFAAATTCALYAMPYTAADGSLAWDVLACFSRSLSWVDPFRTDAEDVLRHERLHFDLVEVHARELRRYFTEFKGPYARREGLRIKALCDQHRALLDAEQAVYDSETRHGTDPVVQPRWESEVAARLTTLDAYR